MRSKFDQVGQQQNTAGRLVEQTASLEGAA